MLRCMEDQPQGKSRISGDELLRPSHRQVAYAHAYVTGLENDREKLHQVEESLNRATWEAVQLGVYNRHLTLAIRDILADLDSGRYDPMKRERIEDLVADSTKVYDELFVCACGHSVYDHDENNRCNYLTCRHICG